MNKSDLVNLVSIRTGQKKKDVQEIVNSMFDVLAEGILTGDKVQILGFGTFVTVMRSEKVGRSIKTGMPVKIPPAMVVRFKAGSEMKRGLIDMQYEQGKNNSCRSVFLKGG